MATCLHCLRTATVKWKVGDEWYLSCDNHIPVEIKINLGHEWLWLDEI